MKLKFLKLAWGFLGIVLVYKLETGRWIKWLANGIGVTPESMLERVILDITVPLALTAGAFLAEFVYGKWLWRALPGVSYVGGRWMYGFLASTPDGVRPTVGSFDVAQNIDGVKVVNGQAYWSVGAQCEERGFFRSYVATADAGLFCFTYRMESNKESEIGGSDYDGYCSVREQGIRDSIPPELHSVGSWHGYINDLKTRRHIWGPVVAVKLHWWTGRKQRVEDVHRALIDLVQRHNGGFEAKASE